jgi:hypothetical protein
MEAVCLAWGDAISKSVLELPDADGKVKIEFEAGLDKTRVELG